MNSSPLTYSNGTNKDDASVTCSKLLVKSEYRLEMGGRLNHPQHIGTHACKGDCFAEHVVDKPFYILSTIDQALMGVSEVAAIVFM